MGNKTSHQIVSDESMKIYTTLTYLNRYEIENYQKTFNVMDNRDKTSNSGEVSFAQFKSSIVSLKNNPFIDRIFAVFTQHRYNNQNGITAISQIARDTVIHNNQSSNRTSPRSSRGESNNFHKLDVKNRFINFEEFLDIMSVFSERAPVHLKAHYAFKMYDFDGDEKIGRNDVAEMIRRLTGIEDDVTKLARGTAELDTNKKRVGVTERKSKPIQTYEHYDKADKGYFKQQNLKNDFFDVSRFIEDTVNAVMREAGVLQKENITDADIGPVTIGFKDFQTILIRNPDFRSHFTVSFFILDRY